MNKPLPRKSELSVADPLVRMLGERDATIKIQTELLESAKDTLLFLRRSGLRQIEDSKAEKRINEIRRHLNKQETK